MLKRKNPQQAHAFDTVLTKKINHKSKTVLFSLKRAVSEK